MKRLIYKPLKAKLKFNKDDLDIKEITLLSIEEAKKLPKVILNKNDWWWLRSPGNLSIYAANVANFGYIDLNGYYVDDAEGGARPALRISNLESFNLKPYHIIKFLNNLWYVISADMLLSIDVVGYTAFNNDYMKQNANKFEGSDIQKWLQNWLQNRLSISESLHGSLNESLKESSLQEVEDLIDTNEIINDIMLTPINELPEGYRHIAPGPQQFMTLYDLILMYNQMFNTKIEIQYENGKPSGLVFYVINEETNGIEEINMLSFDLSKNNSGLLLDLRKFIDDKLNKYDYIKFVGNKNTAINKIYERIAKRYNSTIKDLGRNLTIYILRK